MKTEADRPNCYKCIHVRGVPGSVHKACAHPIIQAVRSEPMGQMLAILASAGRMPPVNVGMDTLNIKGNEIGIRNGWFNWPFNFDPTWLDQCDGFEVVGQEEEEESDG